MPHPQYIADAFVAEFRHVEYALKRSGYLRKDKEIAEADWGLFANELGQPFFDRIKEKGIATNLIGKPPRRLLSTMMWSPEQLTPLTNVTQLMINGVCRVRNSYIHGEKLTGGPEQQWERDVTLVSEAHAVLREAIAFATTVLAEPVS